MHKVICTLLALWMGLFSTLSVATTCCPAPTADQSQVTAADTPPCHDAEAPEATTRSIALDNLDILPEAQSDQELCGSCANGCQCIAANLMLDATPVLNAGVNASNGVITRGVDAVIAALPINPFRPPIA